MRAGDSNQGRTARRYGYLLICWSLLVLGSLLWNLHQETRNTLDAATAAANANIDKDFAFRKWATSHGGVYVQPSEHTPSNPYLNLPDRDVVTSKGKKLTLMNPAYVLRELQTDFADQYGIIGHITSLNLLNPDNAPDAWEAEALRAFENGKKERLEVQQIEGRMYLRLMRPMVTEKGCLKCHSLQGYKEGEIRGGVSTSVYMGPYLARERDLKFILTLTHGAIWLMGLAGLGFSYRRDRYLGAVQEKADERLQRSEKGLAEAQRIAHLGNWELDLVHNALHWSDEIYRIFEIDPDKFGASYEAFLNAIHPDDREMVNKAYTDSLKSKMPYEIVHRLQMKDGRIKYVNEKCETYFGADGAPLRSVGTVHDITGRKLNEEVLLRLNRELHAISNCNQILMRADDERALLGDICWIICEDAGYRMAWVGYPENDAAKTIRPVAWAGVEDGYLAQLEITWADTKHGRGPIGTAVRSGKSVCCQDFSTDPLLEPWRESALQRGYRSSISLPLRSKSDTTFGILTIYSSEPNAFTQEEIRLLEELAGDMAFGIMVLRARIERKRAEDYLQEQEKFSQSLLRLSKNLERSQKYSEVVNSAGDEVKDIVGYPNLWVYLLSENRKYFEALVIGGPDTEMVMSEEGTSRLTIEGDRMLEEIAQAKEIVIIADAQTDPLVNKEIVTRLGNRTIVNVPIVLFDRHMGTVGMGTYGEEGVRIPSVTEQKYLLALASHMAAALDRIHLLAERKKAENVLRELNYDFVTLLENTGDFIYFKDQDSRFRFCSQTLAHITGHDSWRDMRGKNDFEVFPEETARIYHEEEQPIFREGKPLMNRTDPYFDELGKQRWVNTNKWPVFDENKKTVVGIFGISRDITELKIAEDKIVELNRDLEQRVSERTMQLEAVNKELESFSYSVSHDLRTPLRAIDGFSHILLDDYSDKLDDEGKRLVNVVRDNTRRMGQLIDDILKFSRTGRIELIKTAIDMEQMAHTVVEELQSSSTGPRPGVVIESIPPARGDSAMMHQVFVNLLSNAIKFSHNKESPEIRVGATAGDGETVYYVKDNGAGFDMQYADKLFGVFQRLHSINEFEGTGIGLAIVKRIIVRHGGRVWAEGKVNEGATIYFALPNRENSHD